MRSQRGAQVNSVSLIANFDFLGVSPMLLRFFFAVTVVLLSALLLTIVLRRYSAALRHRVWSLSIVAVLLLPWLMLTPARWSLGWLDPPQPAALPDVEAFNSERTPSYKSVPISSRDATGSESVNTVFESAPEWEQDQQFAIENGPPLEVAKSTSSPEITPPQPVAALANRSAVSSLEGSNPKFSLGAILWLVGIVLGLLRIVGSTWTARRLIAGAVPLNNLICRNLAQELSQQLAIKRQPRLLRSSATISPLCIGWWRPCVVVPAEATAWSVDRLRTALAHEFAHVARRDVAWQLTAQLACSVYWFHPLVWVAAWRMRIERETACDDCVLIAGERPSNYATMLLNLAADIKQDRTPTPQTVAVAMVGKSEVEQRIRAILSLNQCRTPVGRRLGRCLTLCAAAVLLAAGAVSPLSSIHGEADAEEKNVTNKEELRHERELSPIGGILQNRKGQPVAGAKVFLREVGSAGYHHPGESRESENFAETVSDEAGRFEFKNVLIPEKVLSKYGRRRTPDSLAVDIIAIAQGQGTVWKHLTVPRTDLRMTFHAEGGVRGRLVDDDGKPIAGVDLRLIQMLEMGQLARRDKTRFKGPHWKSSGFVDLKWSKVPLAATTDKRGRFTIPGLPRKYAATLLVDDERFIRTEIYAATSKKLTDDLTYFHDYELQPPGFTTTVQRGLTVSGKVIAADTGDPIAGAIVVGPDVAEPGGRVRHPSHAHSRSYPHEVLTDKAGRFVMGQFSGRKFTVIVSPPNGSEYLAIRSEIDLSDGNEQRGLTFELPRGVVISGRVVDDETGDGLPGLSLSYQNQSPRRVIVGERKGEKIWGLKPGMLSGPLKTDKDGGFRFTASPGSGMLIVAEPQPNIHTPRIVYSVANSRNVTHEMTVKEGESVSGIEIRFHKRSDFTGRVIDSEGNPVADASVSARFAYNEIETNYYDAKTDKNGRFTLNIMSSFSPDVHRQWIKSQQEDAKEDEKPLKIEIISIHRGRRLGSKISVPAPEKPLKRYSVTLRLEPLTSAAGGKILDLQGRPVAGAEVRLSGWTPSAPVVTGDDGSYHFENLLPDVNYSLSITADGYAVPNSYHSRFEVAPNETHRADFTVAKADQSVSGVIVDPNDQPLANVRVKGSFGTESISKQSPTVITDKQGRFKLTGLPPGLGHVEMKGPAGGRSYSRQIIEIGSTDVRVVFDEPLALERQKAFEEKREKELKARAAARTSGRVLRFPDDHSMGTLQTRVRPAGGIDFGNYYLDWKPIGAAQGKVHIPANMDVQLNASTAASTDLSGLDALQPDDIDSLWLRKTDVTNDGLKHVARLTGLKLLDLDSTRLTDEGIKHLGTLKELRLFKFDGFSVVQEGFGIGDEGVAVLAKLPKLQVMIIRRSNVTDVGMIHLRNMPLLRELDVGGTKVSDRSLPLLSRLPNLESLSLGTYEEGADVTDAGAVHLGRLKTLRHLDLSGTKITDAALVHIGKLPLLEFLSLSYTKVTEQGLGHLSTLKSLKRFRFYFYANVTDEGAGHLAKIPSLVRIRSNLEVTDAGVAELAKLPLLENLNLEGSQITDASLPLIAAMPSLKSLWFQYCGITDEGIQALAGHKSLEYLLISDNANVTGEGLRVLQELPALKSLNLSFDRELLKEQSDKIHLQHLHGLDALTRLIIGGVALSNSDLKNIGRMKTLTYLEIRSGLVVNDEVIGQLAGLTSLNVLSFRETTVTDAGLAQLVDLGDLEHLNISGLFTDRGLEHLNQLKSLRSLQVASPHLTEEGVVHLKQAHPSLQAINHYGYRRDGMGASYRPNDQFLRFGLVKDRRELNALEGQPAPPLSVKDWMNVELDARSLEQLKGKVVILHFWHFRSNRNRRDLQLIPQILQRHADNGLVVIGIHITQNSEEMQGFVKANDIKWPVAADIDDRTGNAYHENLIGMFHLIDRTGKLRFARVHPADLEKAVQSLLAE